jgi:hypothetical protein
LKNASAGWFSLLAKPADAAADTLGEIVLMIVSAAGGYFYWLHKARLFDIE